jgi:hypothetical protein
MRGDGDTRGTTGLAVRARTRAARQERGIAAVAARRVQWGRWARVAMVWQLVSWSAAVIITGLVGFSWILFGFFVIVLSVSCLPLFTHVIARPGWLLERQLRAGDDGALATGHLPTRLARLAEETRILRLALEASAPDEPAIEDLAWAWVSSVRELGRLEVEVLERLGVTEREVVAVLLGEALGQEPVARLVAPDLAQQQRRIELLAEHLEAFEVALLRYDPDPYR